VIGFADESDFSVAGIDAVLVMNNKSVPFLGGVLTDCEPICAPID
jgi:hypothetical protein